MNSFLKAFLINCFSSLEFKSTRWLKPQIYFKFYLSGYEFDCVIDQYEVDSQFLLNTIEKSILDSLFRGFRILDMSENLDDFSPDLKELIDKSCQPIKQAIEFLKPEIQNFVIKNKEDQRLDEIKNATRRLVKNNPDQIDFIKKSIDEEVSRIVVDS